MHPFVDLTVPFAVEVDPIGGEPLQPGRIRHQGLQQRQEGNVGLHAGLLQQPLVLTDLLVPVPEQIGIGHHVLIHRGQPQHQQRCCRLQLFEQLLQAKEKGFRVQLGAPVPAPDPGGVV